MVIPPPKENPIIEKPPEVTPVHDSGEEVIAKRIWIVKSLTSCWMLRGVSE